MKKAFLSLILTALALTVATMTSCGLIPSLIMGALDNDPLRYELNDVGYTVTSCDKKATEVTIPEEYKGKPVTSIGDYAFHFCDSLTSITIPESVESIGDAAFASCYNLSSVEIPESVESIGDEAFAYCYSLTSVKYRGSEAEWNDIYKGYHLDYGAGYYTIIYNYDGK